MSRALGPKGRRDRLMSVFSTPRSAVKVEPGGGAPPTRLPGLGVDIMPNGTFHTIKGILAWTHEGYNLFLDGGGNWILEFGWRDFRRAKKHLGQRMEVEGMRIGFNVLDVRRMKKAPLPKMEIVVVGGMTEIRPVR